MKKHPIRHLLLAILAIASVAFVTVKPTNSYAAFQNKIQRLVAWGGYARPSHHNLPPTKEQAEAVLTSAVKKQVGKQFEWNGSGAFIIDDNQPHLNAKINSAPYAVNQVDNQGRAWRGDSWLNKTTRQYRNRMQTGNGASEWRPAGFLQASHLTGGYSHAYDRGHLLGYALVGGIREFDASESNPANIATQTAWANEARSSMSTGQNYYEGLVRRALDQNHQVRYRVTDIYDGDNLVPSGAHIEALSKDGSLKFNVFVPNVQRNIDINYTNGAVKQR
ncbi:DNA RNA non-specific endonuclease [Limosilactobacillus frumenti DSM 13145]|uniref:DNA RNA non-specific endonuclease n=1 Tax=Limosilactobacillus frumenti DSM 13145 TaxID=1423746 RepID=A0A0R1P4V8_9LACO|nr:DNA/RNA non-specific endonuclease [Limosilactobacillus frumenti]KRL27129.1 DNA RNA non-specific endonuclease [Limosilactobacillus frumenti DSM 13145]MBA2913818.1 DNA/RNA non-specific endonuclease [Limosilactobacillus frumenti]QFG72596.1 DNA/RNA non-specific endonuclease [Limosilactobacillus frumenti]